MAIRGTAVLICVVASVTACTAILGVEDVPKAPDADGGTSSGVINNEGGVVNPDSGGPTSDLAAGINAFISAYCSKARECSRTNFDFSYKDLDECVSAVSQISTKSAALPGATVTGADFQGCAMRFAALTCDAFNAGDTATACNVKGSRKNGDKCISGYQCESGVCASSLTTCRTCIAPREKGADCSQDFTCGPGLFCNGATCVAPSTLGQSCSATQPCINSLKCSGAGACVRPPETAGASCNSTLGCAFDRGLLCLNNQCVSLIINGPQGECNLAPAAGEQPKICRRFAACTANKCGEPPKEGEPCGSISDGLGSCLDPLVCLNGVCTKTPESSFCQ